MIPAEKIEKITFKKFVTTIGNLPSSYVESLSYYECMLWLCDYLQNTVIPAINNNGEAVEELQGLYVELKTYVDSYFDNLNVQTEINNKLDSMFKDGSLYNLIKNYTDPIVNQQNNRITSVENQVSSLANGSPLVASSTSDMTDTTKIYVNTTDGKWYYHNGSEWTAGGTYQSTGIANNEVTYNNLYNNLQNSLDYNFVDNTSYSSGLVIGKYRTATNTEGTSTTTAYLALDVNEDETYRFNSMYSTNYFSTNNPLYLIVDDNNNILESEIITTNTETNIRERIITIPKTGTKLYINTVNSGSSSLSDKYGVNVEKINSFIQKDKISYNQLDDNLKDIFVGEYATVTEGITDYIKPGRLAPSMAIVTGAGYTLKTLNVIPGEKYKINIYNFYGQPSIILGSKDAIYPTSPINDSSTIYNLHGQIIRFIGTENQYNEFEFTIPYGCDIMYLNTDDTKPTTIKKISKYKIDVANVDIDSNSVELNPLDNKTILFNGDSITQSSITYDSEYSAVSPNNNYGYVTRLKANNPSATVYGYGVSGTTIAKRNGQTDSILERTITMFNDHPNADYIILEGGINDMFLSLPLGTISSGYNAALDEYTFCGALESLFKYVSTNFLGKKCGFINLYKVPTCINQPDYQDKLIEICKKWQIPVLNLYEESDLNFYISQVKKAYSRNTPASPDGDALHPNGNGYDILQHKIENWIKSL